LLVHGLHKLTQIKAEFLFKIRHKSLIFRIKIRVSLLVHGLHKLPPIKAKFLFKIRHKLLIFRIKIRVNCLYLELKSVLICVIRG
jgi:uncharacterized protein YfcZ (UPF0381/DUF406 family)